MFDNVIVAVFSVTSVPGIAESNDGTGDADGTVSASVKFSGKTDMIIRKGKLLGMSALHFVLLGVSPNFGCVFWHVHICCRFQFFIS